MHPFIAGQPVPDHEARAPEAARYSRLVRSFRIVWAGRRPQFGPALGLGAALAIAAALVACHGAGTQFDAGTSSSPVQAGSVNLVGLTPERVERVTYEPGASRSWSPGPQIVGVRVLSGRLTVYGGDGEPRVYVTGEGYAAGWAAYRTVNETDQRVETLVTHHVGL